MKYYLKLYIIPYFGVWLRDEQSIIISKYWFYIVQLGIYLRAFDIWWMMNREKSYIIDE